MSIEKQSFGKTGDGKEVDLYILTNANGLTAKLTNYGAILTSLSTPDRKGEFADIVLGYDTLDQYINDSFYFGATVGRYANRIARGKFTLNGVEYTLAANNGPNHLHGGVKAFHKVLWNAQPIEQPNAAAIQFTYLSADGEEAYPGNLTASVTYSLTNDNELRISYEAQTDRPTIVNLTHHSYFNLTGHDSGSILDHILTINANNFTPVDETSIPTGQIEPVANTPMDFTKPTPIGARIDQIKGGYDHNYALNNGKGELSLAARVVDRESGRVLELYTTEPGVQFYTGNYLYNIKGKGGAIYNKHAAFCLEAQHFPDSPNKQWFPSVVLEPGRKYTQLTVHKFLVQ